MDTDQSPFIFLLIFLFLLFGLDPDTANGNTTVETVKDESNKNEKSVKNSKNSNKKAKMANTEPSEPKVESYENGKDETDKLEKIEQENVTKDEETSENVEKPSENTPAVFVPKYKYSDGKCLMRTINVLIYLHIQNIKKEIC